jgi:hypothetical protein
MMTNPIKTVAILALALASLNTFAQDDDMLKLLDQTAGPKTHDKVMATFKESKIINAQTIEAPKAKTVAFNISHLFGNIGVMSNGGVHSLYGLDNISDVRFGFDFGITDKLTLGIGRSKQSELTDGSIKYRILSQTTDNHVPFSLAFYGDMSYCPQLASQFYSGLTPDANFKQTEFQRIAYTSQLILARKFGWRFSAELLPTYQHRNYVLALINADNGAAETNDLLSMGGGFRFKLTTRVAIIADYYYIFSKYRTNNTLIPYYNPLSVGLEIETGGHVFHLNFTNASGIIENNYLVKTTDSWLKGGFKFGFNISRPFNLGHKKEKELEKAKKLSVNDL